MSASKPSSYPMSFGLIYKYLLSNYVGIRYGIHQHNFDSCTVYTAFSGEFCEEDRNGCSEIQCFEGVECMDIPAPGVGAVCGACPEGYTGGATKCYGNYDLN